MTSSRPIDLRLLAGAARSIDEASAPSDPASGEALLGPLSTPIWNPPGADSLSFRPGTYETFLAGMLSRLRLQPVPPDFSRPLANLHLGEPRDWLLGLTEAWAVVGDVLTFYLERIANEGYLRTAVEPFSIWQLLRTIGYAPRPGIAGTTNLAFTVATGRRLPEGVTVPAQTQVRSLPDSANQRPQVYELDAPLRSFASWSAIKPLSAGRTARPPLRVGATSIALEGTRTGLRAGSGLLIVADGGTTRIFRTLSDVAVERVRTNATTGSDASSGGSIGARGVTVASWEEPLARQGPPVLADPQVFAFGKRAHLFGYNAIPWDQLSDAAKMAVCPRRGGVLSSDDRGAVFRPANQGLPTTQVLTLATDGDGRWIAGTVQGFFRSTPDGWQAPTTGLGRAPIQALCLGARGQIFAGTSSGVYRSTDGGVTWSYLAPAALALRRNRKSQTPSLGVAATIGDQLKALGAKVRAFLAKILPSLGRTARPEPRLTGQPVLALAASGDRDANFLFAGTAQGIYRTLASGGGWLPMNQGLPQYDPATGLADVTVRAFAAGADPGTIFAATDQGLFRSTDGGQRWRGAGWGYPRTKSGPAAAHAVTIAIDPRSRQTYVFAATDAGMYRSSDGGDRFSAVGTGLPPAAAGTLGASAPVRLLASAVDETTLSPLLYAATGDEATGLYRSDDLGDSWRALSTSLRPGDPAPSLAALAAIAANGRQLAIASPFDGFLCDGWPGYHLASGQIDLSATIPDLAPQGWAVLTQSRPRPTPFPPLPPRRGAYPVHAVLTVNRDDFGVSAQVSRIETTDDGQLADFDLRTTEANVQSSELPLARLPILEPLEGALLELALPLAEAPGAGRLLAISGRRIRAVLVPSAPPRRLSTDDKARPQVVGPGDRLMILKAPEGAPSPESSRPPSGPPGTGEDLSILWHVETASGVRGRLLARREEFAWQNAGDDDPVIAETVSCLGATAVDPDDDPPADAADPAADPAAASGSPADAAPAAAQPAVAPAGGPRAALRVSPTLRYLYDPSTVTVNANVGTASQGETIPNEVIGSGNANRPNQRFSLRAKPLTFVPDARQGYRSTLEVKVDGVAWREVPTLYGQGPASRVFAVEIDESGAAAVTFGDGTYGARLPTGMENVAARYRAGQWTTPQPAAALRLLQSRPFGLRDVTNPEPAPGAIPPEGTENARTLGPIAVRPLDRIVALDDYADFSRTFPGIARATTTVVWNGRSRLIALTVAGTDGAPVPEDSELYRTLSAAIHGRRYLARPLAIASYARVQFSLAARVQLETRTGASSDEQRKSLRAALLSAFDFAARRFGQGVASSEVIAVLQAVAGVQAVELDALYRTGAAPGLADFLPAHPATWDAAADRLAPAEILVVDPNGILIKLPDDPADSLMSDLGPERLYGLLPEILRYTDAEVGQGLRAFLAVFDQEYAAIERSIAALYDDWFVETCEEWLLPYIGDLVGVRGATLSHALTSRAFVGRSLHYRRRKGTPDALAGAASDATGWPALAVPSFSLLAATESILDPHPRRGGTVDLRRWVAGSGGERARFGGPFDTIQRNVQVTGGPSLAGLLSVSHVGDPGRYGLERIGLFFWRLSSLPVTRATPRAMAAGTFAFHPFGLDSPLFNPPRRREGRPREALLPTPLDAARLNAEAESLARRNGAEDGFLSPEPALEIGVFYAGTTGAAQRIPPQAMLFCDLSSWTRPPATVPSSEGNGDRAIQVAVDPVLGRIAFPNGVDVRRLEVSYAYAFSADLGGGPYARPIEETARADWRAIVGGGATIPAEPYAEPDDDEPSFATLAEALAAWNDAGNADDGARRIGRIRIVGNDLHDLSLASTPFPVELATGTGLGRRLEIVASSGSRPCIVGDLRVEGPPLDGDSGQDLTATLRLDGLWIDGAIVLSGDLATLGLTHCTLRPARRTALDHSGPPPNGLEVAIRSSLVGAIRLPAQGCRLNLADSIVDAAGGSPAIGGTLGVTALADPPGPTSWLARSTIFGRVHITELALASDMLFVDPVQVEWRTRGLVRRSYLPPGSVTPHRESELPEGTPPPSFTSRVFGQPGYAQLGPNCPHAISRGHYGELGAFHSLRQPERLALLPEIAAEFLPWGLEAEIVFAT